MTTNNQDTDTPRGLFAWLRGIKTLRAELYRTNVQLAKERSLSALLERQLDALLDATKEEPAPRPDWVKPANRLREEEVLAAFHVGPDNPLFVAVHQELDDELMDVLDETTRAPGGVMTEELRTFRSGGADALRALQLRLLDRRTRAHRAEKDGEAA